MNNIKLLIVVFLSLWSSGLYSQNILHTSDSSFQKVAIPDTLKIDEVKDTLQNKVNQSVRILNQAGLNTQKKADSVSNISDHLRSKLRSKIDKSDSISALSLLKPGIHSPADSLSNGLNERKRKLESKMDQANHKRDPLSDKFPEILSQASISNATGDDPSTPEVPGSWQSSGQNLTEGWRTDVALPNKDLTDLPTHNDKKLEQLDELELPTEGSVDIKSRDLDQVDEPEIPNSEKVEQHIEDQLTKTDAGELLNDQDTNGGLNGLAIEIPNDDLPTVNPKELFAKEKMQQYVKEKVLTNAVARKNFFDYHEKTMKHMKRYSDVRTFNASAQVNPLKEKKFLQRLVPVLALELQTKQGTFFDVSPGLMYRLLPKIKAGTEYLLRIPLEGDARSLIAPRLSVDYTAFKSLYIRGILERTYISKSDAIKDQTKRVSETNYFVGIGRSFNLSQKIRGSTEVLYDMKHDLESPYTQFHFRTLFFWQ